MLKVASRQRDWVAAAALAASQKSAEALSTLPFHRLSALATDDRDPAAGVSLNATPVANGRAARQRQEGTDVAQLFGGIERRCKQGARRRL
jgi:hypothetical protein